jgi:hypothetical protein
MVESNAVPGFLPSTHGLRFANRFPSGPTVRFGPIDPRWIGVGDASAGLCGGMAWFVRERFEAGLPVPSDTMAPANGSALFRVLVRSQVRSLDWLRTPLRFWWMGAIGSGRALRRSRAVEWPRIRADIDAGRLAMVGLVRHTGFNPFNLTRSHQVLAFAYELAGDAVTIRIYDPNWPGRDDVAVIVESNGLGQSSGEPQHGLLAVCQGLARGPRQAGESSPNQNIVEHHGAPTVANRASAAVTAPGRHSCTRPARARSAKVNVPR